MELQSAKAKYNGFQVDTEDSCYSIGLADKKDGRAAKNILQLETV